MGKVLAIAQNTFKEAIRNRILYVVLVFAILFILAGFVVKDLTIAAHGDTIRTIGLSVISIVSLVLALLIGIGLVYNELDKKTIYTIVSKPIDRWQFLLEGINVTGEDSLQYRRKEKMVVWAYELDARYTLGARYRF